MYIQKSKIKRVYVAGRLSPVGDKAHPVIEYLGNVKNLIRASLDVWFAGYTPFCPALDYQFWFHLNAGEFITEAMIKRYSREWLEVCDAIVLTPGWRQSKGTLKEIEAAKELGIPVFESLTKLIEHDKEEK